MRSIRHPLSGALYDLRDDGTISVTGKDEQTGIFDQHGRWISGALRHADPHLCLWIAGKELPNRFQEAAGAMSAATSNSQETSS